MRKSLRSISKAGIRAKREGPLGERKGRSLAQRQQVEVQRARPKWKKLFPFRDARSGIFTKREPLCHIACSGDRA